jgi:hypothetical protein
VIGLDQSLGSVTVMDIPIDDEDSRASGSLRVPGRDDDVVHQAKAHTSRRQGMVPRWPHCGEGMPSALDRVVHRSRHSTGGAENRGPAVATENGIEEQRSAPTCAHGLESREVGSGVDSEQQITIGRPGFHQVDPSISTKSSENSAQPCWRFGMIGPGIVLEAAGMSIGGKGHINDFRSRL